MWTWLILCFKHGNTLTFILVLKLLYVHLRVLFRCMTSTKRARTDRCLYSLCLGSWQVATSTIRRRNTNSSNNFHSYSTLLTLFLLCCAAINKINEHPTMWWARVAWNNHRYNIVKWQHLAEINFHWLAYQKKVFTHSIFITRCQFLFMLLHSVSAQLRTHNLPLYIETGQFRNIKLEDRLCVTSKKMKVKYTFCLSVLVIHILDSHGYKIFMKTMKVLTLWMLMKNFASFLRSFIIVPPSLSRNVLITEKINYLSLKCICLWDLCRICICMNAWHLFMNWLVIWWHSKPIGLGHNVIFF